MLFRQALSFRGSALERTAAKAPPSAIYHPITTLLTVLCVMDERIFEFQTSVELIDYGRFAYSVVYLPKKICDQLPLKQSPRLRIEGDIVGFPIQGAIQPTAAGERYLLLSKRVLKGAGLEVGDHALVRFSIAPQDAVNVPLALQYALEANDQARRVWEGLTPGKRRGLVVPINNAKTEKTRSKRVEELIESLCESSSRQELQ